MHDDDAITAFEQRQQRPTHEWYTKPLASGRKERTPWAKCASSPAYKGSNTLREYQLEGLNWLSFCWHTKVNSILADEMGLGKTIQSVSLLNYLFEKQGVWGPYLVVAPLSTLPHWQVCVAECRRVPLSAAECC